MPLYSLVVSCHGLGPFTAQLTAKDALSAVRYFLRTPELSGFLAGHKGWPAAFGERDIYAFLARAPHSNLYMCELGRDGKYISIAVARTVSRQEPRPGLAPMQE